MKREDISAELTAKLWAGLHLMMETNRLPVDFGNDAIGDRWRSLLYRWHVHIEHQASDEFNEDYSVTVRRVKALVYTQDFGKLYTFLEFIARDRDMTDERTYIEFALRSSRAAWRLVGKQIVPVSSEEEAGAVVAAVAETALRGPAGAKSHLGKAANLIASGDWAGSVRESIHAVEAVARTFENAGTLPDALKALQRSGHTIHPALANGFKALYGYTSDEQGVRHALIESDKSAVGESEAQFMFGSCASFCQYLLNVGKL
jgi:hypothetical protein